MTPSPLFWLLALALLVVTLALLLWPLLRPRKGVAAPAAESAATAVFRDHRRQIDEDLATGRIDMAEHVQAIVELTARFGAELAASGGGPGPASATASVPRAMPSWIPAMAVIAILPVAAAALYFMLGNPMAINAKSSAPEAQLNDAQVQAMVEGLAAKLKANPEDGEGWAMLARSYLALGRYTESFTAYTEAAKRLPESAALLTDWAEAGAQAQGRRLAGQPTELLQRALQLDPNYPKALALMAAAGVERGDYDLAISSWQKLKNSIPKGGPEEQQVDEVLAELRQRKLNTASAPSTAPPATGSKAAVPPTAARSVEGVVELAAALKDRIAPTDTVFVFARDPNGGRMPLAAAKFPASQLPITFALTDEMAMAPTATISGAKQVVVEARVSKTGNAMPSPGDLAGTSAAVAPGTRSMRITIDRVVP